MDRRSLTAGAASLGLLALQGAAAAPADANATACTGSSAAFWTKACFDVQTAGKGNQVSQLVLYRSKLQIGRDMRPGAIYTATPQMFDPAGRLVQSFQSKQLPKPGALDHGIVLHCNGLLGGTLPNTGFKTPCHTWPAAGFKLGMKLVIQEGAKQETFQTGTVEIKNK